MKNAHLRRYPHCSSLRRTSGYASLLEISDALHLDVFDQPAKHNGLKLPLHPKNFYVLIGPDWIPRSSLWNKAVPASQHLLSGIQDPEEVARTTRNAGKKFFS